MEVFLNFLNRWERWPPTSIDAPCALPAEPFGLERISLESHFESLFGRNEDQYLHFAHTLATGDLRAFIVEQRSDNLLAMSSVDETGAHRMPSTHSAIFDASETGVEGTFELSRNRFN